MEALKLFARYAPNKTFIAVVLGSLAGIFYAILIPVVMSAITRVDDGYAVADKVVKVMGFEVAHVKYAYLFFALCGLILLLKASAEIVLARLALDIRFNLRKDLYLQVENAPIVALEKVGVSRLIQALSTDVATIVLGAQVFPQLLTASVTLLGMLSFLAYLDFAVFSFVMQVIFFGVLAFQIPVFFGSRYYARSREHRDTLQEAFKGLIEGAKELKLSETKREVYKEQVLYHEEHLVKDLEKTGASIFALANNFAALLAFFAIGGLGFVFVNYHTISSSQILAAVMVLLYITGPIAMIMGFIPQLATTNISLRKIKLLNSELPHEPVAADSQPVSKDWQSLILDKVSYHYPLAKNQSEAFGIGPVSLKINKGEVTFITGGNGSGKSTLAKLLTQHYMVEKGQVFVDQQPIDSSNIYDFRQQIACIYSDYHLFDRLLDTKSLDADYVQEVEHYLKAFGIDHKVTLENGKFSTLKLSDGQRRRLALVVTIVEDKSVLLFDEWAADQDPQFKQVFYREILPELKQKNKAVIVISHDDRYFDLADQLIVMESGQLVSATRPNPIPQSA